MDKLTTISFKLPESIKEEVERRFCSGDISLSEFLRDLCFGVIALEEKELRALLREGHMAQIERDKQATIAAAQRADIEARRRILDFDARTGGLSRAVRESLLPTTTNTSIADFNRAAQLRFEGFDRGEITQEQLEAFFDALKAAAPRFGELGPFDRQGFCNLWVELGFTPEEANVIED